MQVSYMPSSRGLSLELSGTYPFELHMHGTNIQGQISRATLDTGSGNHSQGVQEVYLKGW